MKKKFSFVLVLMLLLFCKEMRAQLPEISSSSLPKWYYIQVTGDGDRVDRVFTAEESAVSGRSLDSTLLDQQLWRFESWGSYYVIINKAEGKKLDIIYDSGRGINHAVVNDSPSSMWKLEAMTSTAGYNITATTPPSEKTNAIYAHQANSGGSRDYVVMFETSTWKNGVNSAFNFVEYIEGEENSTLDDSWYYIRVQGETDRARLVYTQEGDYVYGRAISTSDDLNELDKQLWRLENLGDSYVILNKATGKKLDMVYDTNLSINVAMLKDTASTNWIISESTAGYYNIQAETPVEDRATYVYSHQANNYGSRNYIVMFERSTYRTNANSLYQFVYCEYPVPVVSSDDKEVWYVIESQKADFESKCITDVTDQNWMEIKFGLYDYVDGDYTQQWKIVNVNNDEVQLVNRATGNIMQTASVYNRYYYTQPAPYSIDAKGWKINYIGKGQSEISGYNAEGIEVHMNAASDSRESDIYMPENNCDTGFAWTFKKVRENVALMTPSTEITSMDEELSPVTVRISVEDRKIKVIGVEDFTVRNISGIVVDHTRDLPVGIYLVSANGTTTKILVK